MSYDNPRIELHHSVLDIVMAMSEGNPGAVTVLTHMIKNGANVDPDDFMGGLGAILGLDSHDIYGSDIWILYKDVCGESLVRVLTLLRAIQLGFMPERELKDAIAANAPLSDEQWLKYDNEVRTRLPAFGATL